jgi:hypothetical protein
MSLFATGLQPALDASGNPISAATWNFYRTGTLTAAPVYADPSLSTSLGTTVTADSAGRFAVIFLDDEVVYRAVLEDAGGTPVNDVDPANLDFVPPVFTPEQFGAAGDGTTDDYDAWAAMIAAVNAAGTGSVRLGANRTYHLGRYITATNGLAVTDLRIHDCTGLVIDLNGSRIDIKGNFDRDAATTYGLAGIFLEKCRFVVIRNGEIDGNFEQTTNSSGAAEPPSYGIRLGACADVLLENLHLQHFATDGLDVRDAGATPVREVCRRLTAINVQCLRNGRQGMTIVALRGGVFMNCDFSWTGRVEGPYLGHSPQAGVDIEPGRDTTTPAPDTMDADTGDIQFIRCRFEGNRGAQIVAAGGALKVDSVHFESCAIHVNGGSTAGGDALVFGAAKSSLTRSTIDLGPDVLRRLYIAGNASLLDADFAIRECHISGAGQLLRVLSSTLTGVIDIADNVFTSTRTAPETDLVIQGGGATNLRFSRNTVVIPRETFSTGNTGDYRVMVQLRGPRSEGNDFRTDLTPTYGGATTAHFAVDYGVDTVVVDDRFAGTAPGTADTVRPYYNRAFNTVNLYNKYHQNANAGGTVTGRNGNATLLPSVDAEVQVWDGALGADRTVTLSTSAGYAFPGARFRIVRAPTSTGAFNLNVGAGPLKALATGQWCDVRFDGTSWHLTAFGSL